MSEKLTKSALKSELDRRIKYFEYNFNFNDEMSQFDIKERQSFALSTAYGRYRALLEMKWQIERNLFIGGFVS